MKKYTRIILVISGLALVYFLNKLPERVVDSKGRALVTTEGSEIQDEDKDHNGHESSSSLSLDDSVKVATLKNQLEETDQSAVKTLLADSIAEIFGKNYFVDSAAFYYNKIVTYSTSLGGYELAGNGYYSLYRITREDALAEKSMEFYSTILQKDSTRNDLLAKVGFLKAINGKVPPMEGIAMVKKALSNAPQNAEVLLRYGELFQIRGSNDEALVQFRKAVEYNPENLDARIYLVEALRVSKKDDECIAHLNKIKELNKGQDKFIEDYVDRSLKELL